MRHNTYAIGALLICLSLAPGTPAMAKTGHVQAAAHGTSQQQIHNTLERWIAAVNSHSAEAVAALYEPDAVLLPTLSPTVADTPQLRRAYFDAFTAKPDLNGTVNEEHVRSFGKIAVNSGLYTFTYTNDDETVTVPARFSFVYEKTKHGWMIIDHHSSKLPGE